MEDVKALEAEGRVHTFAMKKDTYVWHASSELKARESIVQALTDYEKRYPYRYGMKKAEVQMTYFKKIKANVFDLYVNFLEERQVIRRVEEFLCTPEYEVRKDAVYKNVSKIMKQTMEKAEYDFVRYTEMDFGETARSITDDILNILLEERQIVKVTDDMYTLASYMDRAKEIICERLRENPVITIAEVRDIFHTSRKSAKPILEYMDSIKVTKKTGAESERVVY